jgi:hypothetical protein
MQFGANKQTTIGIPCPDCNELSSEPLKRVVENENDVIPCSLCGGLIDLSVEKCRPLVEQARMLLGLKSKMD